MLTPSVVKRVGTNVSNFVSVGVHMYTVIQLFISLEFNASGEGWVRYRSSDLQLVTWARTRVK